MEPMRPLYDEHAHRQLSGWQEFRVVAGLLCGVIGLPAALLWLLYSLVTWH